MIVIIFTIFISILAIIFAYEAYKDFRGPAIDAYGPIKLSIKNDNIDKYLLKPDQIAISGKHSGEALREFAQIKHTKQLDDLLKIYSAEEISKLNKLSENLNHTEASSDKISKLKTRRVSTRSNKGSKKANKTIKSRSKSTKKASRVLAK